MGIYTYDFQLVRPTLILAMSHVSNPSLLIECGCPPILILLSISVIVILSFLFFIFLGQQTPFIKYVTSLVLLSPSSDSLSQTLCQGFLFIFFHFTSENPRPVYDKLHKMPLILPWLVRKVEIKHQEMEKFLS